MVDGIKSKLNIADSTLLKPTTADSTVRNDSLFTGYFEGKEPVKSPASEIAKKIAESIYGLGGNKNLAELVNLISKDNFKEVMLEYKKIAEGKNAELESKVPSWLPGRGKMLSAFTPKESLLTAIYNESGLDREEKSQMMYKIIQLLAQPENKDIAEDIVKNEIENYTDQKTGAYTSDIIQDLMNNKDDASKALVDIYRKVYRETLKTSFEKTISTNGKIDEKFEQGKENDCWLVAGIMSIASTDDGEEYLNSLLQKDDATGDITVELRGVGEKIVVTQEEIESMSHLSTGDCDIRAIEIAIDKYTRDVAYQNLSATFAENINLNKVDISYDRTEYCYKLLVGNSKKIENASEKILNDEIDFNNPNKKYTFMYTCFEEDETGLICEINKPPYLTGLDFNHAFIVVKSDSDYIYLKNPKDTELEYKVPKSQGLKCNVILESCELPK